MADGETVSACLITRNEAVHIKDCFLSLKGRVEEIVVVDTGSTDETVDIARQAGAVVLNHPWRDDFSAPRNTGLDAATGDWILCIDADERLSAPGTGSIAGLLPGSSVPAARLRFQPALDSTDYAELRLFRNDPRIRFRQIIHEQVIETVRSVCEADGSSVAMATDVRLVHVGYDGNQDHKHARNLPLLRKAIEDDPERIFCWYHLGVTLEALGHRDEAVASLRQAITLAETGRREEEHNTAALCSQSLAGIAMADNNPTEALRVVERGLKLRPANHALRWCQARALLELRQPEDAIPILRALIEIDPESFFDPRTSYKKSLFRQDSYGLLGSIYFMLDQFEQAEAFFKLAAESGNNDLEYVSKAALSRALSQKNQSA